MQLFTPITLTKTEQDILIDTFSNPVVVKYLQSLAQTAVMELASAYDRTELDSTKYHIQGAFTQGGVAAIEQLLELARP